MNERPESRATRAGIVALAGAPNVGKSTLLNRILGRHLSIATAKPQTTRTRIQGVACRGDVQIVFADTPGIHEARGGIHRRMVDRARSEVRGADLTCWLLAANRGVTGVDRAELERLREHTLVVVVNKMDLGRRDALLPIMAEVAGLAPRAECFPVSALRGENVTALVDHLVAAMPEGPWLYPTAVLTDRPLPFLAAEYVREQVFEQLEQEVPYHVAVKTDVFEKRGRKTYIEASIYTDTRSCKKIIVGKDGARVKSIGMAARRRIEELVEGPVYLHLQVRVKEDWQDDPRFLEDLGL